MEIKDLNLEFEMYKITGVFDEYNVLLSKLELNNNIGYIHNKNFLTRTVSDEFYLIKHNTPNIDNYIEKIISCLDMVGLSEDYFERNINSLSKTEKILLEISENLVTNPDVLILKNVLGNLDRNNKLIIKEILKELQKKYMKTIIIIENNINILFDYCSNLVIFKGNDILVNDKMSNVFNNIDYLIDNNIEIPDLIKFSLIASKYQKNINYYNDINDLIKDVYKNAR